MSQRGLSGDLESLITQYCSGEMGASGISVARRWSCGICHLMLLFVVRNRMDELSKCEDIDVLVFEKRRPNEKINLVECGGFSVRRRFLERLIVLLKGVTFLLICKRRRGNKKHLQVDFHVCYSGYVHAAITAWRKQSAGLCVCKCVCKRCSPIRIIFS